MKKCVRISRFYTKKETEVSLLLSLLVAVAARTMLAIAGVANVNFVELAVHAVLIELTVRYAA